MAKSILIVEDDLEQRALFTQACTAIGFRVVAVSDGTAALQSAAQQPFDLLLTDLYLPQCEGDLLIREIKQRQPGIRTVLMSCHHDLYDAAELCPADCTYKKGDLHQLISLLLALVTPKILPLQ